MKLSESLGSMKRLITGAAGPQASRKSDRQLGEPGMLRRLLRWKELESVFLFVTSRCNSRCRTCFYSEELNTGDDLTFDEIRSISLTAPRFDKLWISGGEPFLRRDLAEIIELFHRNNRVQSINLPTNGLLGDRIDRVIGQLLDTCPDLAIHLNFSLDGLGETHDAIRGVENNFETTVATLDRIAGKYGDRPRLLCNVATVITPDSLDELFDLGVFLFQKRTVATQFFETVRGDPRDPSVKRLSAEDLQALHTRVMPLYEGMADRLFEHIDPRGRWLAKLIFIGVIKFAYDLHEQNVDGPHTWGMACTAGRTTAVIDHNGSLRACELRPRIGRLQDYNFDLTAALRSEAMQQEVRAIGGGARANCWCTHSCWILSSLKFSPQTLLFRIPWAYARYRLQRADRLGELTARLVAQARPTG